MTAHCANLPQEEGRNPDAENDLKALELKFAETAAVNRGDVRAIY